MDKRFLMIERKLAIEDPDMPGNIEYVDTIAPGRDCSWYCFRGKCRESHFAIRRSSKCIRMDGICS